MYPPSVFLILISLLALQPSSRVQGISCIKQINTCSCVTDLDGQTLDFSKLDSGGNPPYFTANYEDKRLYEYNPCSAIPCPDIRIAAVCGIFSDIGTYAIGIASSANFLNTPDPYTAIIRYTGSVLGLPTTVDVEFECRRDENPLFFVANNVSDFRYPKFKLYTKYACLNLPSEGGGSGSGAPIGWIVLGVFLGLVLVYLVGGALVNGFYFKRRGLELVPNVGFWKAFGGYIGDGAIFVWVSVKGLFARISGRSGGIGTGSYNPV